MRLRIRIATLVRRALAKVCTVGVPVHASSLTFNSTRLYAILGKNMCSSNTEIGLTKFNSDNDFQIENYALTSACSKDTCLNHYARSSRW